MGSSITEERGLYAALNNCAFVSTETMRDDPSKPFVFLMDASMLGCVLEVSGFRNTNGLAGLNKVEIYLFFCSYL